jgi:membrane protein
MRVRLLLKDLKTEVVDDSIHEVASTMAFHAMFALFPMLVFLVTVGLLVVSADALAEATEMATRTLPPQLATMLQKQVAEMQDAAGGRLALGSAAVSIWGASRGSVALGRALNRVFDRQESRPWWRLQLIGLLVTLSVAGLLIAAVGMLVIGPAIGHLVVDHLGLAEAFDAVWNIGRWVGAAVLIMFIWSALYKFLPDTDAPWRVFTPGAFVGVVLWIGVCVLFGAYVENFSSYEKTYGALGAATAFLMWLWLSNLAMLMGAEINQVLDRRRPPRELHPETGGHEGRAEPGEAGGPARDVSIPRSGREHRPPAETTATSRSPAALAIGGFALLASIGTLAVITTRRRSSTSSSQSTRRAPRGTSGLGAWPKQPPSSREEKKCMNKMSSDEPSTSVGSSRPNGAAWPG